MGILNSERGGWVMDKTSWRRWETTELALEDELELNRKGGKVRKAEEAE